LQFDCDSNVIVRNDLHLEKHSQQRISTEFGIVISVKPDQENAIDSIRCNFDCGSNVIVSNDSHPEKQ
jgi:hypothetical protein